jgi:hypothetical protein
MKRTDITQLFPDAPKETIDKLMDLNGADVNAVKAEVENLKAQLAEAQKNKSGEELQKAQQQITQLQTELDGMKAAETIRLTREKVAGAKKVPAHLLTGETEEACEKQADQILAYVQSSKAYPNLPDGGEIHNPPSNSTRQQFAEWAKENL